MNPLTVQNMLDSLAHYPVEAPLPAPRYDPMVWPDGTMDSPRIALAVPSMRGHMSDEGWQLMLALEAGGYDLAGHGLATYGGHEGSHTLNDLTDVRKILEWNKPGTVFVQDQHEWDTGHLAKPEERFHHIEELAQRPDVFKLTVMKDTHRQSESNKRYSIMQGTHAWVTYYNEAVTLRTLSWIRPQHLIRTWHTVDSNDVPPYTAEGRLPCLLSGSLGGAYPLRTRLHRSLSMLAGTTFMHHPGYHNTGSNTPAYLRELSKYKVAICTASKFGYCLRKIVEATACGCRVITDLPVDEVVPCIDENLVRVHPGIDVAELNQVIRRLCEEYDPAVQARMVMEAMSRFDYRVEGKRLAAAIEQLRREYR